MTEANVRKPRIAVVLGDLAGIGPELVGRLLRDPRTHAQAELVLIADEARLLAGMDLAGGRTPYRTMAEPARAGEPLLLPVPARLGSGFKTGVSSIDGGRHSLETLRIALDAVGRGDADAIVFAPLNKHSLHMAGMTTSDELHWFVDQLGYAGPVCEFNVLDGLWTSRVTSHIALREVADQITPQGIADAIDLINQAIASAGTARPRIAVCGLNPHNGDHGSFGREEIDVIAPAVERARAKGLDVEGPFPADTIFLKVQGAERRYDAVVTMYHDQGQIALKLMGFSRGVTVQGGLPVPILTPAHGTAFDIVDQGKADPSAMQQAFALACRMALARPRERP